MGYNHNLRHQERLFHIQTEDTGPAAAQVKTFVFLQGAAIASRSTDYREWLTHPDLEQKLKKLLQQQHKAMLLELRDGDYDREIARLFPPAPKTTHVTAPMGTVVRPPIRPAPAPIELFSTPSTPVPAPWPTVDELILGWLQDEPAA